MEQAVKPGVLIQSVQRAAALLKAFDSAAPELGVTELSRRVNLHKSTVSRLLATLEREGLVERVGGGDKYRPGLELVRLAGLVQPFGDVRAAAQGVLEELAERSRETVNLAVLDGDEVINVEQVSGPHLVQAGSWVGRRTPLHCVANGKALLALLPAGQARRVIEGDLRRFTERTITDRERLRGEFARVREQGFAVALGEIEEGLHAVAAPIMDRAGGAIAAVSISGPAYRVTPDRIPILGRMAVEAAGRISARMGYAQ